MGRYPYENAPRVDKAALHQSNHFRKIMPQGEVCGYLRGHSIVRWALNPKRLKARAPRIWFYHWGCYASVAGMTGDWKKVEVFITLSNKTDDKTLSWL